MIVCHPSKWSRCDHSFSTVNKSGELGFDFYGCMAAVSSVLALIVERYLTSTAVWQLSAMFLPWSWSHTLFFILHNTVLTLICCLTSTNNPYKITEDVIMVEFVTCQYFFSSFFFRHNVDIPVIFKVAVENSWDILNTIFGHKYH